MAEFFLSNQTHFIFVLTDGRRAHIAEIECDEAAKMVKVLAVKYEQRCGDDELFYQEILYCFCRDRNIASLPLYICLSDAMIERSQLELPKLKPSELRTALAWELSEYEGKMYGWDCREQDDACLIEIVLCDEKCISQLEEAAKETGLKLFGVFSPSEYGFVADEICVTADDAELESTVPDFDGLIQALRCKNSGVYIFKKTASRCCWRRIYLAAGVIMTALSLGAVLLVYADYSTVRREYDVLRQRNELLAAEKTQMEQLLRQESELQSRKAKLKQLVGAVQPVYPFIVSMAAKIPDEVRLTMISVNENKIELKGKASDYSSLNRFREILLDDIFIAAVDDEKAALNDADGKVDFSFQLALNKGQHGSRNDEKIYEKDYE